MAEQEQDKVGCNEGNRPVKKRHGEGTGLDTSLGQGQQRAWSGLMECIDVKNAMLHKERKRKKTTIQRGGTVVK